ncbi:MAG: hypothetical protein Q9195_008909 [Heterodermia aff. obscurata]
MYTGVSRYLVNCMTVCHLASADDIVPGLHDDAANGVRRGKLDLKGTQILSIFNPVFDKIIDLVRRQIEATQRDVKAILLVGGFGQSAYLRETLREALGRSVKVMVPQNGENEPKEFDFHDTRRVRDGRPKEIQVNIRCCSDETNQGPPLYKDGPGVKKLVTLTADLGCIPEEDLEQRRGEDGKWWYYTKYSIAMTNYSASTSYALVCNGKRYDSVTAEYV